MRLRSSSTLVSVVLVAGVLVAAPPAHSAAPGGTTVQQEALAPKIESAEVDLHAPEGVAAEDALTAGSEVTSEPSPTGEPSPTAEPSPAEAADERVSGTDERDEFDVVGVSLAAEEASPDLLVEVRTRQDGEWTSWQQVDLEVVATDPAATEADGTTTVASEPLVAPASDAVQVKLSSPSGEAVPASVTTTTVDGGDEAAASPTSTTTSLSANATSSAGGAPALPQPAVVTRAGWGADESRRTLNPGCGEPSYASSLQAATLHHTAGVNDYTYDQVPGIVRGIYAYHTLPTAKGGQGWCDIGYNALVDKWGRVFEGRYGGLHRPVIGAHAGGFNTGTFGISMIGNYEQVGVPAATVAAVSRMVAWKFSLSGVDPTAKVALTSAGSTRYAKGQVVTLPTVFGHRDVSVTACPGRYGYSQLDTIRAKASQILTNTVIVQAWYQDFLGRPADGGASTWRTLLDDGNARARVLDLFLTNREYLSREVNLSYQSAFGRNADPAGLDGWVGAVQSGRFTLENVAELLYQSEEFFQRSGGTDPLYVKGVYQKVLGRTATDSEANAWAADIARLGRGVVVNRIWRSVEAGQRRITANYVLLLGRQPEPGGLQGWTAYELVYGDAAVRSALATSTEYVIRAAQRF